MEKLIEEYDCALFKSIFNRVNNKCLSLLKSHISGDLANPVALEISYGYSEEIKLLIATLPSQNETREETIQLLEMVYNSDPLLKIKDDTYNPKLEMVMDDIVAGLNFDRWLPAINDFAERGVSKWLNEKGFE